MLAPKIVQVIVGHRHLHAKVEDVRAQAGAPDRIGTLPVGFQQLRTHKSARAAPRSVRARRKTDPFARKKQLAIDVDDARGGTVYQTRHLNVPSEERPPSG